ncbi:MAG: putative porin [Candidatus Limimorpha sp.]
MKILNTILLSLIFVFCHHSLAASSVNDTVKIDSTLVKYFYDNTANQQLGNTFTWDTTTLSASFYDPTNHQFEFFQELSNAGHAHKKLEFSYPSHIGFNNELSSFQKFINTKEDIFYPIIYQPFTEIEYMMGSKKEQHLNVIFSREFLPNLFITLKYNVLQAPSVYQNSFAQNSNFWANVRWNTLNNRYSINGYYVLNKINNYENGGITNDDIFTNVIETDKTVMPVNLLGAQNNISVSGFGLHQHFVLGKPKTPITNNDTVSGKKWDIGWGRINHSIDFQKNSYKYYDNNPLSDFYSNFDQILDSTSTNDTTCFYTLKNSVFWNNLNYGSYNDNIPLFISIGIEHNHTIHFGYKDLTTNEFFGRQSLNNLRFNAVLTINALKSSRITGKGEYIFYGYQKGDYLIDAQWKQTLGTNEKNYGHLTFNANLTKESPDWFEEFYYSNSFRWENNFKKSTYFRISGEYDFRFVKFGIRHTTIDNYIYFAENAKPAQISGNINIISLFTQIDFKHKWLEISGFATLQKSDNESVLHLPMLHCKMKIGCNINLVKGISLIQPSVVIGYFTKYYADAYMPSLRTFYLQDDVLIGNYPFVDLYITFKLKRANIFVGYTNIYSITYDCRYFTTPHYPMRDSKILLGVKWRLYN